MTEILTIAGLIIDAALCIIAALFLTAYIANTYSARKFYKAQMDIYKKQAEEEGNDAPKIQD